MKTIPKKEFIHHLGVLLNMYLFSNGSLPDYDTLEVPKVMADFLNLKEDQLIILKVPNALVGFSLKIKIYSDGSAKLRNKVTGETKNVINWNSPLMKSIRKK